MEDPEDETFKLTTEGGKLKVGIPPVMVWLVLWNIEHGFKQIHILGIYI
jgi:hypothetical protein